METRWFIMVWGRIATMALLLVWLHLLSLILIAGGFVNRSLAFSKDLGDE